MLLKIDDKIIFYTQYVFSYLTLGNCNHQQVVKSTIEGIAAIFQTSGPALQGSVTFSASGTNPDQGLVELPQNVVEPSTLIAANPCHQGASNEFTITGRGGVPPSPNHALGNTSAQFAWVEGSLEQGSRGSQND